MSARETADDTYEKVREEVLENAREAECYEKIKWNGFIEYGEILLDGFLKWEGQRTGSGNVTSKKILSYGEDIHGETTSRSILGRSMQPLQALGYAEKTDENNNYTRWGLEASREELEELREVVAELEPGDAE